MTWLRRFAALAALIVGLIALAALPAQADEVGPYNPPPPVYTSGCNPMSVGIYNVFLDAPQLNTASGPSLNGPLHGNVTATGRIKTWDNTSCSHAMVRMKLQTKACGRIWSCSWQTRSQTDWTLLPTAGELSFPLSMPCRDGDNSYRLEADISHVELDFEETPNGNQVPYLDTKQESKDGDVAKGAC